MDRSTTLLVMGMSAAALAVVVVMVLLPATTPATAPAPRADAQTARMTPQLEPPKAATEDNTIEVSFATHSDFGPDLVILQDDIASPAFAMHFEGRRITPAEIEGLTRTQRARLTHLLADGNRITNEEVDEIFDIIPAKYFPSRATTRRDAVKPSEENE